MSYKVETVNGCTKKIVFDFQTLDLSAEIKTAVLAKQRTANLKGFRKGKAPLSMVEKFFGPQIESDAINHYVQNRFFEAVEKEKINAVGYPSFEKLKYEPGKSLSFEAVVEIFPEVTVKDFSGYKFEKEKVVIEDKDLDGIRNNYLSSKAEVKEVTDPSVSVDKGHMAVINFQGEKANGEKPENMKGEDYVLEVGTNTFIPGFEEGILGMKKGETRVLDLSFPEDYHFDELKGAKVKFTVDLLEIKEKITPEFTDEIAKEFGFESVADFNAKNKENLVKQRSRAVNEKLHQAILEKIISENTFDVPKTLIVQQEAHLKEEVTKTLKSQGFNDEMLEEYFEKWKGDITEKAIFQVRSGLILDTLAKQFDVQSSESDLEKKYEEMAVGTGITADQIKKYYTSDDKLKKNLAYAIREEKTFEKICSMAKVTEK
ncbi:MAG: trigger factor [Bdellovibrio sp. CG12_big_fil_rev_8_21_14_0_65_39_13]|nr:MAG: trigger factor [Bdellovibrio sp. CG22_combo_CG10-13_8_21_14_all_39_27]PIQ61292.1 MAG: trigger factor [Bdellovibrio sp. CG12_big_fil_rev_8_21_14_0_65_39_13]PIR36723.1 MAG: trigger factor [Bdellovibrio sp. CG11_big_fil_rev_8_21_14_0_20_39_38]PJB53446.1 MAG: trigger factor [Bdellovibrio sp. CG_4_9_14_3_um_filter_39_7]